MGIEGNMKDKTLRLITVISLALMLTAFGGCVAQTLRLNKMGKSAAELRTRCSQDSSKIDRMQSELNELKELKKKGGSRPAARKFSYDPKIQKTGPKIAYLTFDDGPSRNTPLLLKTLKAANVHATFFVIGVNCKTYPDAVKQEAGQGHVVGIHSWTHKYSYIYANMTNFMQDFNELRTYLTQQLGTAPDICRFPGGTNNTVSLHYNKNHIMRQAVAEVEAMGIRPIDWTVSAGDAEKRIPSSSQMVRRVISEVGDTHQPVILMHDWGGRTNTIQALPLMIRELKAKGYSFGTLSSRSQVILFRPT